MSLPFLCVCVCMCVLVFCSSANARERQERSRHIKQIIRLLAVHGTIVSTLDGRRLFLRAGDWVRLRLRL